MMIEIDFHSEEAIYIQLQNQIIKGIATEQFCQGDALPSVRQLANLIGINMHTVNKAYGNLKQEGYIQLDRRKGAVIAVREDKLYAMERTKEQLQKTLARAICRNLSANEIHQLVDEVLGEFGVEERWERTRKNIIYE